MKLNNKTFENLTITIFVILVIALVFIAIYKSIVNSTWYEEKHREHSFLNVTTKLNTIGAINYIELYDAHSNAETYYYDFEEDMFSEIACNNYLKCLNDFESQKIFASNRITVFFFDDSFVDFYVTDDLKIYWGNVVEINAPQLINWYLNNRN